MAEQPQFDYSRLSHGDSKALGRVQLRLQRLMAQLAESAALSDDEFERKMVEMDGLVEEAERVISLILVSLPREWLVEGAPADLDWSDVRSLEWVRTDKMDALRVAAVEARHPESVTGK